MSARNPSAFLNDATFTNQLGSVATFKVEGNQISGLYQTGVTADGRPAAQRKLQGILHDDGFLLTFSVCYEEHDSMATWNGKFFYEIPNQFTMSWLLVSNQGPNGVWGATRVGQDTFTRN